MWWWMQGYDTGPCWWKRYWEVRTGAEGRGDTVAPFYANDGLVVSTDPDWLQEEFDTLTGLFDRVVMRKNVGNTVGMVFFPLQE